jgi:tRNA pseudouridine38-40 synthase
MHNYKLTISYDGSRYKGWQRLGEGETTIQAKIEHVLSERLAHPVEIVGSGRTDAGAHALGQVANFRVEESLDVGELKTYLNRYLPDDIAVTAVEKAAEDFHARFNAKEKTYLYRIWNEEHPNPFLRKYSMHVPKKLDVTAMRKGARAFLGEHDFTGYTSARSKSKSMVRTIHAIDLVEASGMIEIHVRGDGFLHNMVRRIVGTLIEVGMGRMSPDAVPAILESKDRERTGPVAESNGLLLEKVGF